VLVGATAASAGAVLRSSARIFGGLGPRRDEVLEGAPPGEEAEVPPTPRAGLLLWGPGLLLLVAGLGLAFVPGLATDAIEQAGHFVDRGAVARETLHGVPPPPLRPENFHVSGLSYGYGLATVLGALACACLGLYRGRLPATLRMITGRCAGPAIARLKLLHDGVVGDYVTWLAVGTAGLGTLFALVLR
jgi:multicomponent Na+:H+ antiporter subunit D